MNRPIQYIIAIALIAGCVLFFYSGKVEYVPAPDYEAAPLIFEPYEEPPNPFRKFLWLNGEWQFAAAGASEWHTVVVPHNWNSVPGLEHYSGPAYYSIEFELPEEWEKGNVFVVFGGVSGYCRVTINGHDVADHSGSYLPFEVDLSQYAVAGGKNVLQLLVDNSPEKDSTGPVVSDEKLFGGIYREVYLELRQDLYFKDIIVTTESLTESTATVKIDAAIDMADYSRVLVFSQVEKPGGGIAASFDSAVDADESGMGYVEWTAQISNPRPWSPENPDIYRASIVALHDTGTADGTAQKFGINTRDIKDGVPYLNGYELKLRGIIWREQLPGGRGPVYSAPLVERDFDYLRVAGFNSILFTHPVHPAVLEKCDREGIVALQEYPATFPDGDRSKEAVNGLREMMHRDMHHPSVLAWGVRADSPDKIFIDEISTAINNNIFNDGRLVYISVEGPASVNQPQGQPPLFLRFNPKHPGHFERVLKQEFPNQQSNKNVLFASVSTPGGSSRVDAVGLYGSDMNQLFTINYFENSMAEISGTSGWFIDSLADFERSYAGTPEPNIYASGLFSLERTPKYSFEHISGLTKEEPEWKYRRLWFGFPVNDLFLLVVIAVVFGILWGSMNGLWPVFIEPDIVYENNGTMRDIVFGLAVFGIPMIAAGAAAASFATGIIASPDILRNSGLTPQVSGFFLDMFRSGAMRFLFFFMLQFMWLLLAALPISLLSGREVLKVTELLARCASLRCIWLLAPFFPVSPWIAVGLASAWELVMQFGTLSRTYSLSSVPAGILVALGNGFAAGVIWLLFYIVLG